MGQKKFGAVLALMSATVLAGCIAQEPEPTAAVPPPPHHSEALAGLPPGAPCSAKIARYQSVLDEDRATGNVEPPVYEAITKEINEAAGACAAGRGGEALRIVRNSQQRHGYHV